MSRYYQYSVRELHRGTGGTFCRFCVGPGRCGASGEYLRYVSRNEAVRDQNAGVAFWNLPILVTDLCSDSRGDYSASRTILYAYAKALESYEISRHQSRGQPRTHYRAILSYETDLHLEQGRTMILSWLRMVFPHARAIAFFHRNTAHLHAHVWIAARQVNGRKINLDARTFRQIDEAWNRVYAQIMGRPEQEHLYKKWETESFKFRCRAAKGGEPIKCLTPIKRPARVAHRWKPIFFTEREREHLGADKPSFTNLSLSHCNEKNKGIEKNECVKSRTSGNQPTTSADSSASERSQQESLPRELPTLPRELPTSPTPHKMSPKRCCISQALKDAEYTISAACQLYDASQHLVEAIQNQNLRMQFNNGAKSNAELAQEEPTLGQEQDKDLALER